MSINNLWKYILVARKHRNSDRISFGMRSKKSLYPEIEKTIRFLHDYETAEISYHKRKCRVLKLDSEWNNQLAMVVF